MKFMCSYLFLAAEDRSGAKSLAALVVSTCTRRSGGQQTISCSLGWDGLGVGIVAGSQDGGRF